MAKSATAHEDVKRRVGVEGAMLVQSGMIVGLGTGSTAAFAIRELGRRVQDEGLDMVGVPTSYSAGLLGREVGITVRTLADVSRIDLALDGADEVDPNKNLIKGGGAAHTQEKVIDSFAERFVVLVDESKVVDKLGEAFPVPIEVLPFADATVRQSLTMLGAAPVVRFGSGKDGPVVTDLGNLVIDAKFSGIDDPAALAAQISAIPGVVEHGLFVDVVDEVIIGSVGDGSVRRI